MAVDVSGLVNMLATVPGQNVANLGATIAAAQESAVKQRQQQLENERQKVKDALETQLKTQQLKVSQLEEIKTKADIAVPIAQQLAMSKDPLVRRQLFESSVSTLKQIGMEEPQLEDFRKNIDNPDYILSKVAQGLAAKDVYAIHQPTTDPSKAPTTRTIRDGTDMVNQEWKPQQQEWVEVGRGPVGKGSTTHISLGKEADIWGKVYDRYAKEMQPIVEQRAEVERVKTAINTPGGASAQALQSSIANLFGGQTRALAELERWATFGNLPDRVVNSATKFLTGEYSEQGKADVLRLLRNWETQYLNKEHEEINTRFEEVAESAKVPKSFYERKVPKVRNLDFSKMDIEELSAIDLTTLELDERYALEERLNELGY